MPASAGAATPASAVPSSAASCGGPFFTVEEVALHNKDGDAWIIVDSQVYDISKWAKKHPGGDKLILFYKGQDATDVFQAFHPEPEKPRALMRGVLRIGALQATSGVPTPLVRDFRALTAKLEQEGYFVSDWRFYAAHLLQIFVLELLALYAAWYAEGSRTAWWLVALLLATSQIQSGWLQHDFGHLSVFRTLAANTLMHKFTINALKGASSIWWKTKHNRHHAKTNVLHHDPDIKVEPLFLFGDRMVDNGWGWKYSSFQHWYWWLLGPPMVTTALFFYQNAHFVHVKRLHEEKVWVIAFFVRFVLGFTYLMGFWNMFCLYWAMRILESMWFTWVTSSNHLAMRIEEDQHRDWVSQQVVGTQNLEGGLLMEWFTGHLNYQVEHHLWPRMPRHNYSKAHPHIVALCKKHGLELRERTFLQACGDVCSALGAAAVRYQKLQQKQQKQQMHLHQQ